jgi:hypothetical protein
MDKRSTPYFFQYTCYAGKEHSIFINYFDYDYWLLSKIDSLIAKTPDLPDEIIKAILKKANVY